MGEPTLAALQPGQSVCLKENVVAPSGDAIRAGTVLQIRKLDGEFLVAEIRSAPRTSPSDSIPGALRVFTQGIVRIPITSKFESHDLLSVRLRNIATKMCEVGDTFQGMILHDLALEAEKLEKALAGARKTAREYANRLCEENLI